MPTRINGLRHLVLTYIIFCSLADSEGIETCHTANKLYECKCSLGQQEFNESAKFFCPLPDKQDAHAVMYVEPKSACVSRLKVLAADGRTCWKGGTFTPRGLILYCRLHRETAAALLNTSSADRKKHGWDLTKEREDQFLAGYLQTAAGHRKCKGVVDSLYFQKGNDISEITNKLDEAHRVKILFDYKQSASNEPWYLQQRLLFLQLLTTFFTPTIINGSTVKFENADSHRLRAFGDLSEILAFSSYDVSQQYDILEFDVLGGAFSRPWLDLLMRAGVNKRAFQKFVLQELAITERRQELRKVARPGVDEKDDEAITEEEFEQALYAEIMSKWLKDQQELPEEFKAVFYQGELDESSGEVVELKEDDSFEQWKGQGADPAALFERIAKIGWHQRPLRVRPPEPEQPEIAGKAADMIELRRLLIGIGAASVLVALAGGTYFVKKKVDLHVAWCCRAMCSAVVRGFRNARSEMRMWTSLAEAPLWD